MSRSGCDGQSFSQDLVPKDVRPGEGPAFLIYYGPAFLQNLGNDSPVMRLGALAEIYRCARQLWPLSMSNVVTNVIVRIDMIKSLSVHEMTEVKMQEDVWIMGKHNESEAFIERSSKKKLNKMIS